MQAAIKAFLFFFLFAGYALAAVPDQTTDSLRRLLSEKRTDTAQVNLLNDLSYGFRRISPDSMRRYAMEALQLSQKIKYHKGSAVSMNNIGIAFHFDARYDSALFYYSSSMGLRERLKDTAGIASCYSNMGIVHYLKGEYDSAMKKHERALLLQEKVKDKRGMANTCNNIASVLRYRGQYQKSLELFIRSVNLYEEAGDKSGMLYALNNIGIIYATLDKSDLAIKTYKEGIKLAELLKDNYILAALSTNLGIQLLQKKNFTEAIQYFEKGYSISQQLNNKQGIATCGVNLGSAYYEMGQYSKALSFVDQAIGICEVTGEKQGMVSALNYRGRILMASGNLSGAETAFQKAISLAGPSGMLNHLESSYLFMSGLYKKKKNFPKAFEYFQLYSNLKDSLLTEESGQTIAEMQARFETEKKEKEILLLQKEQSLKDVRLQEQDSDLRTTNIILLSSGSITILSGVFIVVLVRSFRRKQKRNKLLREKNLSIITQKDIIERKNEEIRNNLLIAGQIQNSIIPGNKLLSSAFKEYWILFMPKDIVSGDFYWIKKLPGRTLAAVIDCTGHGVPGAYMSVLAYELLEEILRKDPDAGPASVLRQLNNRLHLQKSSQGYAEKPGLDIALISIPDEKKELLFAGSRQPLWLIEPDGTFHEYKPEKHFLGLSQETLFKEHHVPVLKQARYYLFSDGFPDQSGGEHGKKLGQQRFRDHLTAGISRAFTEQQESLKSIHLQWRGRKDQVDDITILGFTLA